MCRQQHIKALRELPARYRPLLIRPSKLLANIQVEPEVSNSGETATELQTESPIIVLKEYHGWYGHVNCVANDQSATVYSGCCFSLCHQLFIEQS